MAAADEVELVAGAANYSNITGFSAGGGAANDNLAAVDATYAWFGDGIANLYANGWLAGGTSWQRAH